MLHLFLTTILLFAMTMPASAKSIEYVALGDSYTAGTGATPQEAWPVVMTERLKKKGRAIALTANLAHAGWTTEDLINFELPALKALRPQMVTILIGTNDFVRNVDEKVFQEHIQLIFKEVAQILKNPKWVFVITLPDYSVMPRAAEFADGRDPSMGLARFNDIIRQEAGRHRFSVIDIYPFSQFAGKEPAYSSGDGLHPSAQGYRQWADVMEKAVSAALP